MKKYILLLFLVGSLLAHSQKGITIQVQELSKPEKLLPVKPYDQVLKEIIQTDNDPSTIYVNEDTYHIVAHNSNKESLYPSGQHSFLNGIHLAYAEHRPIVLSPDMIWLLISQGFAQHVNNHAEELRPLIVNHQGKISLIVKNDSIQLDDPNSPWENIFPEFTKQIASFTGKDFVNAMTCDFTTTTPVTKVASEITIMEATKSYFRFVEKALYISCGIPEITLEGSPKDWQRIATKAEYLRKYKLDWWVDELSPILEEFVNASKGKVDTTFWKNMYKYQSANGCGTSSTMNGWFIKFFPYNKFGKRNNLKEINSFYMQPHEVVKVDIEYLKELEDGSCISTPLELWTGFVGLKQNSETFALRPEIGWIIREKEGINLALINQFKLLNKPSANPRAKIARPNPDTLLAATKTVTKKNQYGDELPAYVTIGYPMNRVDGINIGVLTVPEELFYIGDIYSLKIDFENEIKIPEKMGKLNIGLFIMTGKVSDKEIERICKLFPKTVLVINNKEF